jgi:hypothetical protein
MKKIVVDLMAVDAEAGKHWLADVQDKKLSGRLQEIRDRANAKRVHENNVRLRKQRENRS